MKKLLISLSALSIAAASSMAMAQGTGATVGTQSGAGAAVNATSPSASAGINAGGAAGGAVTPASPSAADPGSKASLGAKAQNDTTTSSTDDKPSKGKHTGHAKAKSKKGDTLGATAGADATGTVTK